MAKYSNYNTLTRNKSTDFRKQEVCEGVFMVTYSSHKKLCNAVMRMIIRYDHEIEPMSLRKFKLAYKYLYNKKDFSFHEDWDGFLLTSEMMSHFYKGHWNPLSLQEQKLLKTFKSLYSKGKKFAVIAVSETSTPSTLKHEVAHALFAINDNYHKEVYKVLDSINLKDVYRILRKQGYHEKDLDDEAHSYLMNNLNWLKEQGLKSYSSYFEVSAKLNYIFEKYA